MADPIDTAAIRARADAATEGPWEWDYEAMYGAGQLMGECAVPEDDRTFIAHARTDVPALCDALDAARKRIAELEPYLVLTPQSCAAHVEGHPDWLMDTEHHIICPWCERDHARAEVANLRSIATLNAELSDPNNPAFIPSKHVRALMDERDALRAENERQRVSLSMCAERHADLIDVDAERANAVADLDALRARVAALPDDEALTEKVALALRCKCRHGAAFVCNCSECVTHASYDRACPRHGDRSVVAAAAATAVRDYLLGES